MEQLIETNWEQANRIVRFDAHKHGYRNHDELEEIFQDTMCRLIRYPPDMSKAKDPTALFGKHVFMNANAVLRERRGYRRDAKATGTNKRTTRAVGQGDTYAVGLFRPSKNGDDYYMDERILPSMASAEDVYFSSLPSKRQERLRGAIQALPEKQRVVMEHQVYEELTVAQSAKLLGCSNSLVQHYRGEALKTLRDQLNPGGGDG